MVLANLTYTAYHLRPPAFVNCCACAYAHAAVHACNAYAHAAVRACNAYAHAAVHLPWTCMTFNFTASPLIKCDPKPDVAQKMWDYAWYGVHKVCQNRFAKTIYKRCISGYFGREITKYTVICGVYIWFWPTLRTCTSCMAVCLLVSLLAQSLHAHRKYAQKLWPTLRTCTS